MLRLTLVTRAFSFESSKLGLEMRWGLNIGAKDALRATEKLVGLLIVHLFVRVVERNSCCVLPHYIM
jgi:hypothetical protein